MHLQYWQMSSVCHFDLILQTMGEEKNTKGQWTNKFQCQKEGFYFFLLMTCKLTFISPSSEQNKNKKNTPTHLAGSLSTSHHKRLHLISSLMGTKPIRRRTDVPLEGKEKSQTPELPIQQFTLKDSVLCFTRDMAQKVQLAKRWECKNGLMPPLCCTDSRLLQDQIPSEYTGAAAGAAV